MVNINFMLLRGNSVMFINMEAFISMAVYIPDKNYYFCYFLLTCLLSFPKNISTITSGCKTNECLIIIFHVVGGSSSPFSY